MNDEKLLELNSLGLVPGPAESAEDFLKRANYCLNLKNEWNFQEEKSELSEAAFKKIKNIFGISPFWVPFFFSSHQLMPWHAGAAWIFQEKEELPTAAFFQIKPDFKIRYSYLKIYSRDELIAHEMAHVGRMMFEEPKFEELLAYRTSNSSFRRFFGPLVQSSKESLIFMFFLFLSVLCDFFFLFSDQSLYLEYAIKLTPVALVCFALLRLFKRQYTFSRALKRLKNIAKNESAAEAILYRLKDAEIILFSKLSPSAIKEHIQKEKKESLRFHLIAHYF